MMTPLPRLSCGGLPAVEAIKERRNSSLRFSRSLKSFFLKYDREAHLSHCMKLGEEGSVAHQILLN